jgi:hypothetical protein
MCKGMAWRSVRVAAGLWFGGGVLKRMDVEFGGDFSQGGLMSYVDVIRRSIGARTLMYCGN